MYFVLRTNSFPFEIRSELIFICFLDLEKKVQPLKIDGKKYQFLLQKSIASPSWKIYSSLHVYICTYICVYMYVYNHSSSRTAHHLGLIHNARYTHSLPDEFPISLNSVIIGDVCWCSQRNDNVIWIKTTPLSVCIRVYSARGRDWSLCIEIFNRNVQRDAASRSLH